MELFGVHVIERFTRKHRDAARWLGLWRNVVERAQWQSLDDVRHDYPGTDGVKASSGMIVTVFNVKGNEYRMLCYISYPRQQVAIAEIVTHGEYSKDFWKDRL